MGVRGVVSGGGGVSNIGYVCKQEAGWCKINT